jgi:hypothetical protein
MSKDSDTYVDLEYPNCFRVLMGLVYSLSLSPPLTSSLVPGPPYPPLYLKGQSHEIFDPRFFSSINPP